MSDITKISEAASSRRACILHAEDDQFTSVSIARLLTLKGFRVESASNGLDALTELLAHPAAYDLIITDQSMPSLTGVEWLQAIRDAGFAGKIIVFAAALPDELMNRFRELGVERILNKSGSLKSLMDAIEELVGEPATGKGGAHGLES